MGPRAGNDRAKIGGRSRLLLGTRRARAGPWEKGAPAPDPVRGRPFGRIVPTDRESLQESVPKAREAGGMAVARGVRPGTGYRDANRPRDLPRAAARPAGAGGLPGQAPSPAGGGSYQPGAPASEWPVLEGVHAPAPRARRRPLLSPAESSRPP